MNILIVEDDSFKFAEIKNFIIKNGVPEEAIILKQAVADTVEFLNSYSPDKIILDMSLPSHVAELGEGSPLGLTSGGMEVIRELSYLGKVNIPIIILTQYPQIQINNDYYPISDVAKVITDKFNFKSLIVDEFDDDSSHWKNSTKRFLQQ